jgi:hypothetical protein
MIRPDRESRLAVKRSQLDFSARLATDVNLTSGQVDMSQNAPIEPKTSY